MPFPTLTEQTRPQSGTGAANTITPRFIGDIYVKTDTPTVYIAKGTTTADWVEVSN